MSFNNKTPNSRLSGLLVYSPASEKNTGSFAGEVGAYIVSRTVYRTAGPKDGLAQTMEKALLLCYNDLGRMRIANAFYPARHIDRTRK